VWLGERPDPSREIGPRRLFRKGERQARELWRRDTEAWSAAAARALATGGWLVQIVGDGWVPGGPVDAAGPSIAAAEQAGLALRAGASLERPDHGGRHALREHVLAFQKL